MKKKRLDSRGNELFCGEYERTDGRYGYHYRNRQGDWKWIYAVRLSDLRNEEVKIMYLQQLDITKKIKNITFDDQYELWIASKQNIRSSTRAGYELLYDRFIKNSVGKKLIDEITTFDIKSHYMSLHISERVSVETISRVQNVMYQVFQSAVERGLIIRNPAERACKDLVRKHSKHKSIRNGLSTEQAESFLEFLRNSPKNRRWYPVIYTLVYTGLRISELAGLRWEDVDFERKLITIDHALIRCVNKGNKEEYHVFQPKTQAGNRQIPFSDGLAEALQMEKSHQEEMSIKCLSSVDGYTNFIFLNRFGHHLNQAIVNRAIHRLQFEYSHNLFSNDKDNSVILPTISTHSLRHTYANILCEKGFNIKSIQYLMGHDDISTTLDIYTKQSLENIVAEYKDRM